MRLPEGEASHLTRVLRLKPGASVQVFDGRGHEFAARVQSVDRGVVLVETSGPVTPAHEPRVVITLGQAALKGRKFDTVVRDATMLGVTAIRPILTAHTDVPEPSGRLEALRARWQRLAVASAKQCRRAVVPDVESVQSFAEHVSSADDVHIVLVEPTAGLEPEGLDRVGARPERATITIGPEGGWSDDELDHARAAGCRLLTIGPRTLRADATPVAALSVFLYIWGEL